MWHQTHNTYTQVSSECGIPALILFLMALGTTFRRLSKTTKTTDPVLGGIAQVVFTSMFGFAVCVIFLSHAYDFPLVVSSGLAIAINRLAPGVVEDETSSIRSLTPQRVLNRPSRRYAT